MHDWVPSGASGIACLARSATVWLQISTAHVLRVTRDTEVFLQRHSRLTSSATLVICRRSAQRVLVISRRGVNGKGSASIGSGDAPHATNTIATGTHSQSIRDSETGASHQGVGISASDEIAGKGGCSGRTEKFCNAPSLYVQV